MEIDVSKVQNTSGPPIAQVEDLFQNDKLLVKMLPNNNLSAESQNIFFEKTLISTTLLFHDKKDKLPAELYSPEFPDRRKCGILYDGSKNVLAGSARAFWTPTTDMLFQKHDVGSVWQWQRLIQELIRFYFVPLVQMYYDQTQKDQHEAYDFVLRFFGQILEDERDLESGVKVSDYSPENMQKILSTEDYDLMESILNHDYGESDHLRKGLEKLLGPDSKSWPFWTRVFEQGIKAPWNNVELQESVEAGWLQKETEDDYYLDTTLQARLGVIGDIDDVTEKIKRDYHHGTQTGGSVQAQLQRVNEVLYHFERDDDSLGCFTLGQQTDCNHVDYCKGKPLYQWDNESFTIRHVKVNGFERWRENFIKQHPSQVYQGAFGQDLSQKPSILRRFLAMFW
jgi:hypothetical protein